ncbi:hypothetical protein [Roseivirga sp. E12]|uniref:hypothetical protein n=1 Tax=Roseivirga sp. E12 TaxID=2819237 RepID=UPI001ABCB7DC|nr:hypothetical protein [Roseivirga sp. E12]MBO3700368.1 hypothetical protein [Roseivirga sp. E12]
MRKINVKQFLKILKGEDLEFRISPFPFTLNQSIHVAGIHLPYDLDFKSCLFDDVVFTDCRFSGNIMMSETTVRSLSFDKCRLHDIEIVSSSMDHLTVGQSSELKELTVKSSDINSIVIENNPIYETIHIGCENNVRDCLISDNGEPEHNSFSTKVFICPEKFENITLNNLTTEALHIGTFGEYAKFTVKDVTAEVVLIDGCSAELSKVRFENVQPRDASVSALHFINTPFDPEVFGDGAFSNYKVTKIHHQNVDASSLLVR